MNYIRRIQAENAALKEQLQKGQASVNDFIGFLHSDKFKGQESDGARKDWIATGDVIHRLQDLRKDLTP